MNPYPYPYPLLPATAISYLSASVHPPTQPRTKLKTNRPPTYLSFLNTDYNSY